MDFQVSSELLSSKESRCLPFQFDLAAVSPSLEAQEVGGEPGLDYVLALAPVEIGMSEEAEPQWSHAHLVSERTYVEDG